jgi:hypothetical protein
MLRNKNSTMLAYQMGLKAFRRAGGNGGKGRIRMVGKMVLPALEPFCR